MTCATSSYIRPHEMGGQEHTEGEHNNRDIIGESMIRQHTHEVVLQYHWLSYYVEKKREREWERDKEMESKKQIPNRIHAVYIFNKKHNVYFPQQQCLSSALSSCNGARPLTTFPLQAKSPVPNVPNSPVRTSRASDNKSVSSRRLLILGSPVAPHRHIFQGHLGAQQGNNSS